MDLSVVIITWNQAELLSACIESVREHGFSGNHELIVIDNGSTDDTPSLLAASDGIRVIRNSENLGVAKARNQGIQHSSGKYILHLDDDTVVHEGSLDTMTEFMERHRSVWLAGGRLLNPDGTLQPSARTFYTPGAILARRTPWGNSRRGRSIQREHLMENWDHDDSRTVDWVSGACFCMRREAVEEIGMLDDHYFFGVEDVDWSYRVWKAGGLVSYCHRAVITHHYQRSSRKLLSRKALSHLASLVRFHLKHGFRYPDRPHSSGEPLILE